MDQSSRPYSSCPVCRICPLVTYLIYPTLTQHPQADPNTSCEKKPVILAPSTETCYQHWNGHAETYRVTLGKPARYL